MRMLVALMVASFCFVGCGDDDEGQGGGGGGVQGSGCLTVDEAGRPLLCYFYSGSGFQLMPGGAATFCPKDSETLKTVSSCPRNDRLVGTCESPLGLDMTQTVFYYVPEGNIDEAAPMYEGMCSTGKWTRVN